LEVGSLDEVGVDTALLPKQSTTFPAESMARFILGGIRLNWSGTIGTPFIGLGPPPEVESPADVLQNAKLIPLLDRRMRRSIPNECI
jgi:hypothetical protein